MKRSLWYEIWVLILWVPLYFAMALGGSYGPESQRMLTFSMVTTLAFTFVAIGVGATMPFAHYGISTNSGLVDATILGIAVYFALATTCRYLIKYYSPFGDPFA